MESAKKKVGEHLKGSKGHMIGDRIRTSLLGLPRRFGHGFLEGEPYFFIFLALAVLA